MVSRQGRKASCRSSTWATSPPSVSLMTVRYRRFHRSQFNINKWLIFVSVLVCVWPWKIPILVFIPVGVSLSFCFFYFFVYFGSCRNRWCVSVSLWTCSILPDPDLRTKGSSKSDLILLEQNFFNFLAELAFKFSVHRESRLVYSRFVWPCFNSYLYPNRHQNKMWSVTLVKILKNNFLTFRTKLWLWLVRIVRGWNTWMLAVAVL